MTKTKTNSRRVPPYQRPIVIITFVLIVTGAAILALCLLRARPVSNAGRDQADLNSSAHHDGSDSDETPPDKTIQYEGEDPNTLDELTGYITLRSIVGGNLTVVASIDQYLSSDSNCRLVLKNSDGTEVRHTDALPVTAEATSSACGPFTVPVDQLPSGDYTIDITMASPDKSGHIISEITM